VYDGAWRKDLKLQRTPLGSLNFKPQNQQPERSLREGFLLTLIQKIIPWLA
jgi:hypothetical protein